MCFVRYELIYYTTFLLSCQALFFLLTIKTQSNTVRFKRACVLYLTFRLLSRGFFVIFRVLGIIFALLYIQKIYI